MNFLTMIALRNLGRQKKRNFLLGISIAFGVMILVVATSFSQGITDIMFNRIIRYVAGQVSVSFYEKNMLWCQIFRDKDRMTKLIEHEDPAILQSDESVGIFSRAIGNGKADNVMLVSIDTKKELSAKEREEIEQSFKMVEGSFRDLSDSSVENPAIISTDKARDLNIKRNDVIRVRFKNIFGQQQAAKVTVVGIMKITNVFMSGVIFLELQDGKRLLGYQPWEMGSVTFTLKDPKRNAMRVADKVHSALKPGLALIRGSVEAHQNGVPAVVLGFFNSDESKQRLLEHVTLPGGDIQAIGKKGVLVSSSMAKTLKIAAGDTITLRYDNKFDNKKTARDYTVTGIYQPKDSLSQDVVLFNEHVFYDTYYDALPANNGPPSYTPQPSDPVYASLATEWVLLPRTKTTDDFKKKIRQITSKKSKALAIDVATMYENASDVLKLENALNIITIAAVLILFFIILIGVINTLRMTIRERTREIGTMRAVGMQKDDVRNVFLLETFFLTLFSSTAGITMAFIVMGSISKMKIDVMDNPMGMFLVDSRIYFLPTWSSITASVILIITIALVTAFFPARRAANLKAAEAIRHYE